jgi:hypothetical protein
LLFKCGLVNVKHTFKFFFRQSIAIVAAAVAVAIVVVTIVIVTIVVGIVVGIVVVAVLTITGFEEVPYAKCIYVRCV